MNLRQLFDWSLRTSNQQIRASISTEVPALAQCCADGVRRIRTGQPEAGLQEGRWLGTSKYNGYSWQRRRQCGVTWGPHAQFRKAVPIQVAGKAYRRAQLGEVFAPLETGNGEEGTGVSKVHLGWEGPQLANQVGRPTVTSSAIKKRGSNGQVGEAVPVKVSSSGKTRSCTVTCSCSREEDRRIG